MYVRKTYDEYVLETNYGYGDGWEEVLTESAYHEIRERKREYQENMPQYPYRIRKRRVKKMNTKWFGIVRWCNDDIASMLEGMGIDATEKNIAAVRCACENNHHFTDGMIEAGWAAIEYTINCLNEKGELDK